MKGMGSMIRFFTSLNTALVLIFLMTVIFFYGSITMPFHEEFSELYFLALIRWMFKNPFHITWWLWTALVISILLTLNTIICSIQSIIRKSEGRRFLITVAPELMHAGFLFILLGHLLSSISSEREFFILREDSEISLGSGYIRIERIDFSIDREGYINDMSAWIRYISSDGDKVHEIKPNKPFISDGIGIYLKTVRPYPHLYAIFEYSKEPGAIPALIGGLLFLAGNVLLLLGKKDRFNLRTSDS